MKLQLLLVDDEPKILQGLINNDWASVGMGEVFRAASGLEAVEVLKQQPIDIVVTDIRMPGMDGLQLCKHVHDHYPRTKCILLSGYGEFEYARRAMEHGTVGYLLKPVKDEDLLAEVDRVGGLVREEWERVHTLARARQTLRTHLPQLREGLLGDLLAGREYAAEALRKQLSEYRLPFAPGDACALVLIRVDQAFAPSWKQDIALFEYAVLNVAEELLGAAYTVWHCRDPFGYLCLLLKEREGNALESPGPEAGQSAQLLYQNMLALQHKTASLLKGSISLMIMEQAEFPGQLPEQYRRSLNELRKIPRSEQQLILVPDATRTVNRMLLSMFSPPGIQQLLEAGRWEEAKEKLRAIEQEMDAKKLDTEEQLLAFYYLLVNAFLGIAHQQGKTLMELAGFPADIAATPPAFRSGGDIVSWALEIIGRMEQSGTVEFHDHKSQLITRIHRFIEAHLAQDVSLQAIADHVNLHAVYLSTFYKQERNENLSEYIMRYRMDKAAVLLKTTDIKIYELASRLGFSNPPYFSKIFKGHYGMTPQEFKERFNAQP